MGRVQVQVLPGPFITHSHSVYVVVVILYYCVHSNGGEICMYREITKEELLKAMQNACSRRQVISYLKLPQTGTANKFIKELIHRYQINELDYYNRKARQYSLINQVSIQELQNIINNSKTYKEVLEKLGYNAVAGSAYRTLKDKIKKLNLDTSSLTHKAETHLYLPNTYEQVFCEHSTVTQSCLRNRVLKENIVPYVCTICGNKGE